MVGTKGGRGERKKKRIPDDDDDDVWSGFYSQTTKALKFMRFAITFAPHASTRTPKNTTCGFFFFFPPVQPHKSQKNTTGTRARRRTRDEFLRIFLSYTLFKFRPIIRSRLSFSGGPSFREPNDFMFSWVFFFSFPFPPSNYQSREL